MYRELQDIIQAIDEFDDECKDLAHTDAGEAWDLLEWIREQAEKALKEVLDDHS